jgi:hypothetical protein
MIWKPVPSKHLNGSDDIRACVGRTGCVGDTTRASAPSKSAASGNSENFREIMLPQMLPNDAERTTQGCIRSLGQISTADFSHAKPRSREAAKNAKNAKNAKDNLFC